MNSVPNVRRDAPKKNTFDLTHEKKLSTQFGRLTPIFFQEVVAGDRFTITQETFIRLAPMLRPVMHLINVYTHYFFVPFRLLWQNPYNKDDSWETFSTGGRLGLTEPEFPTLLVHPQEMEVGFFSPSSLADYLGFPVIDPVRPIPPNNVGLARMPFSAYQLVYNEYYRDETLQPFGDTFDLTVEQPPIDIPLEGGSFSDRPKIRALMTLRSRNWEKDYFTTALPFTQRGKEVEISLGGAAPLYADPNGDKTLEGFPKDFINSNRFVNGSAPSQTVYSSEGVPANSSIKTELLSSASGGSNTQISVNWSNAYADLSQSTGITINQLRESIVLQQFYEKMARGGSRYTEYLQTIFGTSPSDARLQRPEYIGGMKEPVVISEILQTSQDDGNSPQGNMSGHGLTYGKTNTVSKEIQEPGYIIGLMSIMPKPSYFQGMPKQFSRRTRFDFLIPQFAHLGEQPVTNGELFYGLSNSNSNDETFGYQERYAEYRYIPSTIHGSFREEGMFNWHLSRYFGNTPTLSSEFLRVDKELNDLNRIFSVQGIDNDPFWIQMLFKVYAKRPLPVYGEPGLTKI